MHSFYTATPVRIFANLPESEQERAFSAKAQLSKLADHMIRFYDALALMERCELEIHETKVARDARIAETPDLSTEIGTSAIERIKRLSSWKQMAVRDSTLRIHDFHIDMINAKVNVEKCPVL